MSTVSATWLAGKKPAASIDHVVFWNIIHDEWSYIVKMDSNRELRFPSLEVMEEKIIK